MIVPACDRPTVAVPIRAQGRHVMESESAAIHRKMRQQACQLPITGFAHKAAVIRDALVVTVIALLYVTTKRCSSAKFDRGHDAMLRGGQRSAITLTKGFTVAAEDIRHFQPATGHRTGAQNCCGGVGFGSTGIGRGSRSSGLDAAQTLLVAIRR